MPAGMIDEQYGMCTVSYVFGDFSKMQVYRDSVAHRHDEVRALTSL